MNTLSRLLAASVLAFSLASCMSTSTTSIAGHSISAKYCSLCSATLDSNGQAALVTLAGKSLQITNYQISWAPDGAINLPQSWNNMELTECCGTIEVTLDGKKFTKINPPSK